MKLFSGKVAIMRVFVAITIVFGITLHAAQELDVVKELVIKAESFYKTNGREKLLSELNNPKGRFVKGEIYVFALDMKGIGLANINPKLVGKDQFELKDADGKYFFKEMINVAKTKGNGWVNYKWTNPISKKIEAKTVYLQRIDDNTIIGCGTYKK